MDGMTYSYNEDIGGSFKKSIDNGVLEVDVGCESMDVCDEYEDY